jgi:exonuclease V gamma subunit
MQKQGESNINLRVVYGNDLNLLAHQLAADFFSAASHPFEKRLIVVPNASVKEFLFYRFVQDPTLKMAAGVQVLPLNQAVTEILHCFSQASDKKKIPSFLELSLSIEEKLHSSSMSSFSSLQAYLEGEDNQVRKKRIAMLSDELARLFTRYGLHGSQFLPQWMQSTGWQQVLWHSLFAKDSPWTYPLEALKRSEEKEIGKIALFGFSYLPKVHLSFFNSVFASVYQISPCSLYWGDYASDKERLFLSRTLERKGMKEHVREELMGYMQQNHSLLSNWGKIGRRSLSRARRDQLVKRVATFSADSR